MTPDWTRETLEKHYVGKMTATTIPVNLKFSGEHRILDMSELESIIKNAKILAQDNCTCRERVGNCIEPMDGCIGIDDDAVESIEKYDGKEITAEEALASLKRTYDAGLVHMAYIFEGRDKVERICSCCSCCCHSLSAAIRFGYPNHAFHSKYIAQQNPESCSNCGTCVERCQFHARIMINDELEYKSEKCFGCGLCLESCSGDAIILVEREP
jgi:uncharacterized Fe-S center protein